MKTKKIVMILICAVVVGISAMTASAEEREDEPDQNLPDSEPLVIAPSQDSAEVESDTEEPLLIAPLSGSDEPVVSSCVTEKDNKNLIETMGIPILGMICVIGVVTIAIVIIYKKK